MAGKEWFQKETGHLERARRQEWLNERRRPEFNDIITTGSKNGFANCAIIVAHTADRMIFVYGKNLQALLWLLFIVLTPTVDISVIWTGYQNISVDIAEGRATEGAHNAFTRCCQFKFSWGSLLLGGCGQIVDCWLLSTLKAEQSGANTVEANTSTSLGVRAKEPWYCMKYTIVLFFKLLSI